MSHENKYIGRWYNEKLNIHYYPGLLKSVGDETNIHLRRANNRIGNSFQDISSKLEIIGYHVHSIKDRLKQSEQILPKILLDVENSISRNFTTRHRAAIDKNRWIEFYDYVLVSHIEGALIQSKALLDSIAQMYSIAFNREIKTFSKYGRSLLNDINQLKNEFDSFKIELTQIIKEHKETWIDDIIKNRDIVVHYGQLRNFRCPMLLLDERTKYSVEEVRVATMPNEESVFDFSSDLLNDVHIFTKSIMKVIFTKLTNNAKESDLTEFKSLPSRNALCPCGSGDKYKSCHGKIA